MRAKSVNEIRREIEGGGLSPVGIGKISMFRAYDYFKRVHPESITGQTIEKFLERNKSMIDENKLQEFLPKPYSDYIKIEGLTNSYMGDYFDKIKGHGKTGYISVNDDEYYIHSYYNIKYNVGFFHSVITGGPHASNYYVYFVKYKD